MTIRHDEDHRYGLALGDEVVKDDAGAAEVLPFVLVASHSMEKVEDRILFLRIRLIACRCVDVHPAVGLESVGMVPYGAD